MNTLKNFWILIFAFTLGFVACNDDDDDPKIDSSTQSTYVGKLTVGETNAFSLDSIITNSTLTDHAATLLPDTLFLEMKKVKFAEKMPVAIDMTLNITNFTKEGNNVTFEHKSITPYAMGGYSEAYSLTDIKGSIENDSLKVQFKRMGLLAVYNGKISK